MDDDDLSWLPPSEQALARQVAPIARTIRQFIEDAGAGNAIGLPFEQRVALSAVAANRELEISKRILVIVATRMVSHGINRADASFAGSIALPAMAVAGYGSLTTALLELPADHPAGARKQVISWQLFLIVLMWIIVIAGPIAIQHLRVASRTEGTIDDYYNIAVTLAASITFALVPGVVKKARKRQPIDN